VITVSTSSFTGMPHADTVVYANSDQHIFFFVMPGSTVARNIDDSRHVSFTVDDYTTDWRKLRELQGVGKSGPCPAGIAEQAMSLFGAKFGASFVRPDGVLYGVGPNEMHFIDYDYDSMTPAATPDVSRRTFEFGGALPPPTRAPIATNLNQTTFDAGAIIFRPGTSEGRYFIVIEGEVEVRAEGHGADQTVTHIQPGQLFGDQAALRGQQGALTAHAVSRTVLLEVRRDSIRELTLA
jgi:hypothetical protein